ncbi:MAG TPA: tRNA preQ1(34) S-adenosylmethionine ribosyltransferase-isomerase QueA [Planctomycetota bacterium]|nr:tRNA preQ1(34) S-adenosylmethionine ribosyltransferase-isomerase QueA [Planctomycetota bacterium]
MQTSELDYDLPRELIAQHPVQKRDESRLMVLHRASGAVSHRIFRDIIEYFRPGDVLVLNDTRVLPVKLIGRRRTGGKIDALLVREVRTGLWQAMLISTRRLNDGEPLTFEDGAIAAKYRGRAENDLPLVEFATPEHLHHKLAECGRAPLPPYIKRDTAADSFRPDDLARYQTVYAAHAGAIAAPTAGLHYTPEILDALKALGVAVETLTLHVGPGTFKPIKTPSLDEHRVDPEQYQVPAGLPERIVQAKAQGRRIVCVGTTSCRVLESLARMEAGQWTLSGWTDLFIRPPFEFRWVDVLQTNFHVPRSSLLALVFAFAGRERILQAYEDAKKTGYRFYSYGDAMLIA